MARTLDRLRGDLSRIRNLVETNELVSLGGEESGRIREEALRLLRRLESLDGAQLTLGLLGGTGVGKSTLMNALAMREISSTSHRRPHTGKILVYRHRASMPARELFQPRELFQEYLHEVDSVGQIILCDLPDFDSILGAHRDIVVRFLSSLDLLLWVASPEKYADESFHAFLRSTPKAADNYTFVLNKADLFFDGRSSDVGYELLAAAMKSFRDRLVESGVSNPVIYPVSGREARELEFVSLWNQFGSLRRDLFRLRDSKEVLAIKSANLDSETRDLLRSVEREIHLLAEVREVLTSVAEQGEEELGVRVAEGAQAIAELIETRCRPTVEENLWDSSALVGTAHLVGSVFSLLKPVRGGGEVSRFPDENLRGSNALALVARQMRGMEDQLAHRLLRKGIPVEVLSRLTDLPPAGGWSEALRHRIEETLQTRLRMDSEGTSSGFRLAQRACHAVVILFLLLTLAGPALSEFALEKWFESSLALIASMVMNLFTPSGLAALTSTVLLNLVLGLRFFTRYRKSLRLRAQKFIETLKIELKALLEAEWNRIIEEFRRSERTIAMRADHLSRLLRDESED